MNNNNDNSADNGRQRERELRFCTLLLELYWCETQAIDWQASLMPTRGSFGLITVKWTSDWLIKNKNHLLANSRITLCLSLKSTNNSINKSELGAVNIIFSFYRPIVVLLTLAGRQSSQWSMRKFYIQGNCESNRTYLHCCLGSHACNLTKPLNALELRLTSRCLRLTWEKGSRWE